MSFAADTRVVRLGPGCFGAELSDRWSSLVGIHGGYSAAVVVRAVEAVVADPERPLRTVAVQFAAAPAPGPATIEVTVERAGRSMTTTSARLRQDGRLLLVVHAVSAASRGGLAYEDERRPGAADPGATPLFSPPFPVPHFANLEVRLDPRVAPFSGSGEAWMAAWLRPHGGEAIDAAWLVAMCDVLPPAVFTRATGPVRAASIEYVVHLATGAPQLPAGEHAYLSCRSPLSAEGFAVEDATLWAPDGRVLAVARQTRLAGV